MRRLRPLPSTAPWRAVTDARLWGGCSGIIKGTRSYSWELVLACGHTADRPARYLPNPDRPPGQRRLGFYHNRSRSHLIETPPKRVRCHACPQETP